MIRRSTRSSGSMVGGGVVRKRCGYRPNVEDAKPQWIITPIRFVASPFRRPGRTVKVGGVNIGPKCGWSIRIITSSCCVGCCSKILVSNGSDTGSHTNRHDAVIQVGRVIRRKTCLEIRVVVCRVYAVVLLFQQRRNMEMACQVLVPSAVLAPLQR